MEELKPAEILKAVHTCGESYCTTDRHECLYGDDGCIDCVDRLEADFESLIAAGDNLIIRRAAPENKPLTLDELRGMDGEPVWVRGMAVWGLVATCGTSVWIRFNSGDAKYICSADGYEIYARKPEGEKKS